MGGVNVAANDCPKKITFMLVLFRRAMATLSFENFPGDGVNLDVVNL
jgi:hypothetical protein